MIGVNITCSYQDTVGTAIAGSCINEIGVCATYDSTNSEESLPCMQVTIC